MLCYFVMTTVKHGNDLKEIEVCLTVTSFSQGVSAMEIQSLCKKIWKVILKLR